MRGIIKKKKKKKKEEISESVLPGFSLEKKQRGTAATSSSPYSGGTHSNHCSSIFEFSNFHNFSIFETTSSLLPKSDWKNSKFFFYFSIIFVVYNGLERTGLYMFYSINCIRMYIYIYKDRFHALSYSVCRVRASSFGAQIRPVILQNQIPPFLTTCFFFYYLSSDPKKKEI